MYKNVDIVSNTRSTKNNSLYAFLTKFPDKAAEVILKYNVQKMANHNAYLINLPGNTGKHQALTSHPDYILNEKHLRIDATYPKNNKCLTPVHYTEIYHNQNSQKKLVVHVYYNYAGTCTHLAMKTIDSVNNKEKNLVISSENNKIILANLEPATILLRQLLVSKTKLYQTVLETADQISVELDQLSKKINEKNGLSKYIKKANNFIACINQINLLNETLLDRRGMILRKHITQLLSNEQQTQAASSCDELSNQPDPTVIEITLPHNAKINDQNTLSELTNKANQYLIQLNTLTQSGANSLASWCKFDQLLFDIQLVSLELLFAPAKKTKHNRNAANSSLNNKLATAISKIKTLLSNSLSEAMCAGNLELIKDTFSISKHYLNPYCCNNFFEYLYGLSVKTDEQETHAEQLGELCDFLYKESDNFRFISGITSNMWFPFGKTRLSIIFLLYQNNNLPIFKKYIEYGANIETAMIENIENPRFLPLINNLICLYVFTKNKTYKNINFIKHLLSFNIKLQSGQDLSRHIRTNPSNPHNLSEYIIKNTHLIKYEEHLAAENQDTTPSIFTNIFKHTYELSPLEILFLVPCNNMIDKNLIELLIPISDLKCLTLIMASLSNSYLIDTTFTPCVNQRGVHLFDNIGNKPACYKNLVRSNSNQIMWSMHIKKNVPDDFIQAVNIVYNAFNQKVNMIETDDEIMACFNQINANLRNSTEASNVYKIKQIRAQLFLLALKNNLDLQEAKTIILLLKKLRTIHTQEGLPTEEVINNIKFFIATSNLKKDLLVTFPEYCVTEPETAVHYKLKM